MYKTSYWIDHFMRDKRHKNHLYNFYHSKEGKRSNFFIMNKVYYLK